MSVKRLVPLHAVALETDPANPRIGDIYFNTVNSELRYWDGTSWSPVGGAITGLLDHILPELIALKGIDEVEGQRHKDDANKTARGFSR